jgi:hypothetical protein
LWFSGTFSALTDTEIRVWVGSGISSSQTPQALTDNGWLFWNNFEEASGTFSDFCEAYSPTQGGSWTYSQAGVVGNGAIPGADGRWYPAFPFTKIKNVNKFTIMLWQDGGNSIALNNNMILHFTSGANFIIIYRDTAVERWSWAKTGFGSSTASGTASDSAGTMYHKAFVYDGTQSTNLTKCVYYKNGSSFFTASTGTIPTSTINDNNCYCQLGGSASAYQKKADIYRFNSNILSSGQVTTQFNIENHYTSAFYVVGSWVPIVSGGSRLPVIQNTLQKDYLMALKNQAVVVTYYAYDTSANSGKTGDAINHTLRLYQDGAESTPAGTPAEVDATNCPGLYKIALTAAEMNYNSVTLHGKSSTANIVITPVQIITEAVSAAVLGATVPGSYTSGTLAYQVGRIGSASAVVQSSVSTSLAVTAIIGDGKVQGSNNWRKRFSIFQNLHYHDSHRSK